MAERPIKRPHRRRVVGHELEVVAEAVYVERVVPADGLQAVDRAERTARAERGMTERAADAGIQHAPALRRRVAPSSVDDIGDAGGRLIEALFIADFDHRPGHGPQLDQQQAEPGHAHRPGRAAGPPPEAEDQQGGAGRHEDGQGQRVKRKPHLLAFWNSENRLTDQGRNAGCKDDEDEDGRKSLPPRRQGDRLRKQGVRRGADQQGGEQPGRDERPDVQAKGVKARKTGVGEQRPAAQRQRPQHQPQSGVPADAAPT